MVNTQASLGWAKPIAGPRGRAGSAGSMGLAQALDRSVAPLRSNRATSAGRIAPWLCGVHP
jgi:hypothetical protein